MGTPLPENKVGPPCPVCWGAGKAWGDFSTPYIIPVHFFELEPGEFWIPGDEQILLMRHALEPSGLQCGWELHVADYWIQLSWGVFGSMLFMTNTNTGKIVFAAEPDEICERRFENNRDIPDNNQAFNGIAIVDIPQEPF
jgi:hypothetical protein